MLRHSLFIINYFYLSNILWTIRSPGQMYIYFPCHPNPIYSKQPNNVQEITMKKELCLVIPVYNESAAIKNVLQSWEDYLSRYSIDFDIHVYNDGSKDNTIDILTKEAQKYSNLFIHDKKNSGHGPTILLGYNENKDDYDWIFQIDSDNEMLPDDFIKLWSKRSDYDFLIGKRNHRVQSKARYMISRISRITVSLLFGKTIWDVNSPYRLMRTSAFRNIFPLIPANTLAPNIISGFIGIKRLKFYETLVNHQCRTTGEVSIKKWKLFKFAVKAFWQTVWFRFTLKN